jgi:hypothetical protein
MRMKLSSEMRVHFLVRGIGFVAGLILSVAARAAESLPDLVTVGSGSVSAELSAIDADGAFVFRTESNEEVKVPAERLVRWSTPVVSRAADVAVLVDGSVLSLKAAWGKSPSFGATRPFANARTIAFGELELPRWCVRAVFWRLPTDAAERHARISSLLESQSKEPESDLVLLDNGDTLTGSITRVGVMPDRHAFSDIEVEREIVVNVHSPIGETPIPLERVRGIVLSPRTSVPPVPKDADSRPRFRVGLRDGSLIAADALRGEGERVKLASRMLGEREVELKDIVSIQAYGERVAYLSDLQAASYRSEPYLDLDWTYKRDQNVLGGAANVGGRRYLKAIGTHSAARLTYDLDGSYDRFAAAVAINDAAEGAGSVVFRVLLKRGGEWREAYASGIVRCGDAPRGVAVDLNSSERIALVVDYADRGDERDYADWLDPRLERGGAAP